MTLLVISLALNLTFAGWWLAKRFHRWLYKDDYNDQECGDVKARTGKTHPGDWLA